METKEYRGTGTTYRGWVQEQTLLRFCPHCSGAYVCATTKWRQRIAAEERRLLRADRNAVAREAVEAGDCEWA